MDKIIDFAQLTMSKFDLNMIRSVKGPLKIFQAFINFFGAVFCFTSPYGRRRESRFFEFVSMAGLIIDLLLLLLAMNLAKISSKIKFMPYIEMALDGIWSLFYLIAANIIIKDIRYDGYWIPWSVVCGYVAMITYFLDALLVYKETQIINHFKNYFCLKFQDI